MSNYRYVHAVGKHSFLQDMISPKQRDACAKMFEALEVRAEKAEAELQNWKDEVDSLEADIGGYEAHICNVESENDKLKAEIERLESAIYEAIGDIESGKPKMLPLCEAIKYNPVFEGGGYWFDDRPDFIKGTDMMWHPWKKEKEEAMKAQGEGGE